MRIFKLFSVVLFCVIVFVGWLRRRGKRFIGYVSFERYCSPPIQRNQGLAVATYTAASGQNPHRRRNLILHRL